jgi:hypothetical protein
VKLQISPLFSTRLIPPISGPFHNPEPPNARKWRGAEANSLASAFDLQVFLKIFSIIFKIK